MKRIIPALTLLAAFTPLITCGADGSCGKSKTCSADRVEMPTVEQLKAQGFRSLFNGKDLTGWRIPEGDNGHWKVVDGAITLKRDFDGREHNLDYLWTKQQCDDFVLELEYKVPERANSGVFLRTLDRKNPVYTGLEVQVTNSYGREKTTRGGTAGALYDLKTPTINAAKPAGQWNTFRIRCRGPRIIVELNGRKVNEVNLDEWTEPHKNPDGSKNKFPRAIKDFARRGFIGLQDHGRPVWYRNIRIQPLD